MTCGLLCCCLNLCVRPEELVQELTTPLRSAEVVRAVLISLRKTIGDDDYEKLKAGQLRRRSAALTPSAASPMAPVDVAVAVGPSRVLQRPLPVVAWDNDADKLPPNDEHGTDEDGVNRSGGNDVAAINPNLLDDDFRNIENLPYFFKNLTSELVH